MWEVLDCGLGASLFFLPRHMARILVDAGVLSFYRDHAGLDEEGVREFFLPGAEEFDSPFY